MIKKKNGQITLFIILGIIILFIVALVLYLQNSFNIIKPPVQQLVVDEELKPIQSYVTDCLSATAKEGLIKLGNNGGYITIPTGMKIDPIRPYNSDALFFNPQIIPYWYYMKSCSESSVGCINSNNMPPICANGAKCILPYTGPNSMEEQLNIFIEKNIAICIADFAPFKDKYDIKPGKINVETKIAQEGVGFKLDYPLDITIKGSNQKGKIPYFYTEHKINLGKIYQFAKDIRDAEKNYNFLERNTLNLITAYSGVDSNLLPPMSGMDIFTPGKKYWIRTDIKEKLMSDILPYTMLLQIANSRNAKVIYSRSTDPKTISFENGLYQSMMLKVSNNTYFDLDANIYYPQDSDIYLKIGDSEIIKPKNFETGDNFIFKMLGFVMNDYSFRYDISYPVIVSIRNPNAFNGEGFTFNYAMEANIRQNLPVTENNSNAINVVNVQTTDIDDISQRVNRTITIETYNKYTKEPLEDVTISYKCGGQFVIGTTAITDGKATLSDKFPFCEFGGEIVYDKVGYMSGVIDYSNTEGTDSKKFRIEMWPLQEKKIKVYKRSNDDINGIRTLGADGIVSYNSKYSPLNSNDTVFLNIARVKDDSRESDVPLVGFLLVKDSMTNLPKAVTKQDQIDYINKLFATGDINESEKSSMLYDVETTTYIPEPVIATETDYLVDLIPGTYNINAFMIFDGNILIPEEKTSLCTKIMGVCITGKTDMVLPEQNFSSWITGGVNINVTLTENDVYANNTLIIYVAEMPKPTNWEDLQNTPSIESYQEDKMAFLYPTMEYP